jgi:hypothetical protein
MRTTEDARRLRGAKAFLAAAFCRQPQEQGAQFLSGAGFLIIHVTSTPFLN